MSRNRGTRADGELTRTRILETAGQLFAAHGFAATPSKAIAAQAEVDLASINYHFGSRNGPLEVESGFSGARLGMAMWIRGHKISPQLMTSGVHLIIARDGHYEGAADPRREGTVRGE